MQKDQEILDIISAMTVEEKVGQMQQLSKNAVDADVFARFQESGLPGSYLHVLGHETAEFTEGVENSRLQIPPIFGIDAIHGHGLLKEATIFPTQLAMACSFDEEMVERIGEITADEVAADGLNWVFSPVLCLGRDLRWGRINETFGEDPLLASRLGKAIIEGYQKNGKVAACAKHYLGYGEATGGRDSYDSQFTERKAREVFLKPFKAAADAGCMTMMTAYGSVDSVSVTTSHKWLTEILKEELGFDGFLVTDWENFRSLYRGQKVAANMDEACIMGIEAGNDMSMNSPEFFDSLCKAAKEGKISMDRIDDAVYRILHVKKRLGILEVNTPEKLSKEIIGCTAHQNDNYKATTKSMVLLKNDEILPLNGNIKRIAVIGPNADDVWAQYGDWTHFSHPGVKPNDTPKDGVYTMLRGIREVFADAEVVYAKGCSVRGEEATEESNALFQQALDAAQNADVVILCIGDDWWQTGEYRDRCDLNLSGRQVELAKAIANVNPNMVTVLVNGKPLVVEPVAEVSKAVVETFNSGDMGGLALASLLAGKENFSGKLPISFPTLSGAGPFYYNQFDYWHGGKYIEGDAKSKYPFGYGLSYSDMVLSAPVLDVCNDGKLSLKVTVKNCSDTDGWEVVQLYFKDEVCRILTPIRTLLDFKRVFVPANGEALAEFIIDTNDLGYYDENCNYCVDPGEFTFHVSNNGKEFQMVSFVL
jgi:beta-glucosidase